MNDAERSRWYVSSVGPDIDMFDVIRLGGDMKFIEQVTFGVTEADERKRSGLLLI